MNHTNKLLDIYMERMQLTTATAVALKLGVTRPAVSNWRAMTSHAEPELVSKMAKACGLDPEEWALRVQADREIKPERKQVWLRSAQRLAAAATAFTLIFGLLNVQTIQAQGVTSFSRNPGTLYIMSNLKNWARSVGTVIALWLLPITRKRDRALQMAF